MSAFSLAYSRALPIVKSDNANIPYPAVNQTGANTALVATNVLYDSSAAFVNNGVNTGDIVYNVTDGLMATVVSVAGNFSLTMNADIFTATSKNYIIYVASPQSTIGNYGCYLYIGVAGNVSVDTIGNDLNVTFLNVPAGTILPVQVKRLRAATSATNIIALW